MTVGTTGNWFSHAGDGTTKAFPFPRPFFDQASLRVILVDAAGGETLIETRRTDLQQNTSYRACDRFSSEAHEDALDKGIHIAQDIAEQLARAPKLKESTATPTPIFPEAEAGKFVTWNAAGSDLENREGCREQGSRFLTNWPTPRQTARELTSPGCRPTSRLRAAAAALASGLRSMPDTARERQAL
jgi:hypothetical protein